MSDIIVSFFWHLYFAR